MIHEQPYLGFSRYIVAYLFPFCFPCYLLITMLFFFRGGRTKNAQPPWSSVDSLLMQHTTGRQLLGRRLIIDIRCVCLCVVSSSLPALNTYSGALSSLSVCCQLVCPFQGRCGGRGQMQIINTHTHTR